MKGRALWSADNRFIGFANRKLKKIDVSGGPAQTLCDAPNAWGPERRRSNPNRLDIKGINRVSASGGTPHRFRLDESRKELAQARHCFCPTAAIFCIRVGPAVQRTVLFVAALTES